MIPGQPSWITWKDYEDDGDVRAKFTADVAAALDARKLELRAEESPEDDH
jgi:hypothetical protein